MKIKYAYKTAGPTIVNKRNVNSSMLYYSVNGKLYYVQLIFKTIQHAFAISFLFDPIQHYLLTVCRKHSP